MLYHLGRALKRLGCIRHGHNLRCTPWGHSCDRCGLTWPTYPF